MGLCINYELSLHAPSDEDAEQLMERLRGYCETLGAETVTPVIRLSGRDLALPVDAHEPWSAERFMHILANISRSHRDGTDGGVEDADRLAALVFLLNPGEGSETAFVGLVRPGLSAVRPDADRAHLQGRWYWSSWCKTQYASTISDEHLVHCHLIVVRTLEEAMRLGCHVEVRDETGYWETRSTDRLIAAVRNMNRIVARVAGAFHDATGGQVPLESPVFADPDFERLETEPLEDPEE